MNAQVVAGVAEKWQVSGSSRANMEEQIVKLDANHDGTVLVLVHARFLVLVGDHRRTCLALERVGDFRRLSFGTQITIDELREGMKLEFALTLSSAHIQAILELTGSDKGSTSINSPELVTLLQVQ